MTARLFPTSSVFEVTRADGAARLAVAWSALEATCCGAGEKAATAVTRAAVELEEAS